MTDAFAPLPSAAFGQCRSQISRFCRHRRATRTSTLPHCRSNKAIAPPFGRNGCCFYPNKLGQATQLLLAKHACERDLRIAVCAMSSLFASLRLPRLLRRDALDLCNCYPVDVFYNYDQEYIKTRLTCTDSALVRWIFVSVPTASAPHLINFLCEPACAFAIFEVAKGTALFERSLVVFIAGY